LPGPPTIVWAKWGIESGVTQTDIDAVKTGRYALWLLGRIEYQDAEGMLHFTMFRGRYDLEISGFTPVQPGNDAN
jgi:hypothetical protein